MMLNDLGRKINRHLHNMNAAAAAQKHVKERTDNLAKLKLEQEAMRKVNTESTDIIKPDAEFDLLLTDQSFKDIHDSIHEALQSEKLDIKITLSGTSITMSHSDDILELNEENMKAILKILSTIFTTPALTLKSFSLNLFIAYEYDSSAPEENTALERLSTEILDKCAAEFQNLAEVLYQNETLENLELDLFQYGNLFTRLLSRKNVNTQHLTFTSSCSTIFVKRAVQNYTQAIAELAEIIKDNHTLLTVHLPFVAKFECIDALKKIFTASPSITSLNLDQDGSSLIDKFVNDASFDFIRTNSDLLQTNIRAIGLTLLGSTNKCLREVSLQDYYFSERNLRLFSKVLRTNRSLTSLAISYHQKIPQKLLVKFANALLHNPIIKTFALEPAYVNDEVDNTGNTTEGFDPLYRDWSSEIDEGYSSAATAFAKVLSEDELSCLKTGVWNWQDPILLANAWSNNRSLLTLSLPFLCINLRTASKFLDCVTKNTNLVELNVQLKHEYDIDWQSKGSLSVLYDLEEHDEPCLELCHIKTFQEKIDEIIHLRNVPLRANWSGITLLISFVKANLNSALHLSVLPLLNTIFNFAAINNSGKYGRINLSTFSRTRYFTHAVNNLNPMMINTNLSTTSPLPTINTTQKCEFDRYFNFDDNSSFSEINFLSVDNWHDTEEFTDETGELRRLAIPNSGSRITSLQCLDSMGDLNFAKFITNILENNPLITALDLRMCLNILPPDKNKICQDNIKQIGTTLLDNESLTRLSLAGYEMDEENCERFIEVLEINDTLTCISISLSKLHLEKALSLLEICRTTKTIRELNICNITENTKNKADYEYEDSTIHHGYSSKYDGYLNKQQIKDIQVEINRILSERRIVVQSSPLILNTTSNSSTTTSTTNTSTTTQSRKRKGM